MNLHPDTAQKLREARALIERGWCQGTYARTEAGAMAATQDERAVMWCAVGACYATHCDPNTLAKALPSDCVWIDTWNDAEGRTQAEVLALFDKAIEIAERGA